MKRFLLTTAIVLVSATPAMALKVTNLDTVPHAVELSGTGTPERYVIAPNATEQLTGRTQGFLALVDKTPQGKATKKPAHSSVVHADGMLSGVIGNERSDGIPADPDNSYVIWPGGKLQLQSRVKPLQAR